MRLAYFTEYSFPNVDGVWTRVYNECRYFIKKKNKCFVFSNNILKPSKILAPEETFEGIKIFRFPVKRITENASFWPKIEVLKKLTQAQPDVIICNNRHPEVKIALKYAKASNIPCVLVTHAPFLEKGVRPKWLDFIVKLYDKTFDYNQFSAVIAIANWEVPYLLNLGVKKHKITVIPNSIPAEFFKSKPKKGKDIIFLGRIAPVKDIETLIRASKNINLNISLVGPVEPDYEIQLKNLISKLGVRNINFLPPVFNIKKKINLIDKHDIFVLPSKREGLPQSLIEAMARGKIVISSRNQGAREIIVNGKNGFLFDIGNEAQLAEIVRKLSITKESEKNKIRKNAVKTARNYSEDILMKKQELVLKKLLVP
jgi:glycosyltransferase involved in cell wall biosynthesis